MDKSSMFDKNKDFFEAVFPGMGKKIQEQVLYENVVCSYETREKKIGLYIQGEEGIIQLNSQYSSKIYADLWAEHVLEQEELGREHIMVVFGVGNGDYIKALTDRIPEEVVIVCYEPSLPIFLEAMKYIDFEEIMKDNVIVFVEGLNMDVFNECWRKLVSISNGSLVHAASLPIYSRLFHEELQLFIKKIQEQNELVHVEWNTKKRFARSFTGNQIAMLPYFVKSHSLKGLFEKLPDNYPAIIVAAGPSLKKNIKELKNAKNKALIIAVDTSVKLLLKEGIIPDIYVTVDPEKALELFDDDRIHQIPVCLCPFSVRESFEKQKNKMFISLGDSYIGRVCLGRNKRRGFLGTGGTVAQQAFMLAIEANMNPVILVGQDLAYTNDTTHAEGAFKEEKNVKEMNQDSFIWVEDIYGNQVKTIGNLNLYRKWYEDVIKNNISDNVRIIDATEGGAKIKGTEIIPLKEVIEKECTRGMNYGQLIDSVSTLFTEEEQNELVHEFKMFPGIFERIQETSHEAVDVYERLLDLSEQEELDVDEVKQLMQQLDTLSEVIESRLEYMLIEPYVEEAAEKAMKNLDMEDDDIRNDLRNVADRGLTMMNAIQKAIPEIMPEVEKMLKVLADV